MFGDDEASANRLTLREQAVVQALVANLTVDQIAVQLRTSAATVKEQVAAIYRKARLRTVQAGMFEYVSSQADWRERCRLLTLRRMLESENARELHLHLLAALRAWTGAGQAFQWEIVSRRGGLRLVGESGIRYAVRRDGVVPALVTEPVAMVGADSIRSEEWAAVARAESGSLPIEGEVIALAVAHTRGRWMALLSNLPDGRAHPAAVEIALTLADMAATVAAAWEERLKKIAASAGVGADCNARKPA
ncbi:MAG: LuxR C-terminal-related transcriptional regulator [Terriglobales bacterium]